jgi:hypothetical protein
MASPKEEHEWLVKHHKEAEKYSGRWIAILDGKIAADGTSFGAVRRKAAGKNTGNAPLVLYIPKKGEELLIL